MSAYEKLYNKKPMLTHLRVIGCLSFAKNLSESDKLQSRSRLSVLLGYSATQKGYILFDINENKLFVSRDVEFREDIFPFSQNPNQN